MDTNSHTVTIPMSDYRELLKTQEFIGIEMLSKESPLFQALDEAYRQIHLKKSNFFGTSSPDMYGGIPANMEIYIRFKTPSSK